MKKTPIYNTSKVKELLDPNVVEPEAAYEPAEPLREKNGREAVLNSRRNILW